MIMIVGIILMKMVAFQETAQSQNSGAVMVDACTELTDVTGSTIAMTIPTRPIVKTINAVIMNSIAPIHNIVSLCK